MQDAERARRKSIAVMVDDARAAPALRQSSWKSRLAPEEKIALLLGRKWRLRSRHRTRLTLAREPFIEHLMLESTLQTGLWRLLLFFALFMLILIVTRLGTPDT